MDDPTAARDEVAADAEAIDEALAAFEDACAQLVQAADQATDHPRGHRHLAAVQERLAAVSAPVTASTADALLAAAADARAALLRVLVGEDDDEPEPDASAAADDAAPADEDEDEDDPELAESDPVLDLAPEPDPAPVAPPPAPAGYLASTSLPTRNLPHVLVFDGGRWQRASIAFADDDTLVVHTASGRRGPGRRLREFTPAQIARPHAKG